MVGVAGAMMYGADLINERVILPQLVDELNKRYNEVYSPRLHEHYEQTRSGSRSKPIIPD